MAVSVVTCLGGSIASAVALFVSLCLAGKCWNQIEWSICDEKLVYQNLIINEYIDERYSHFPWLGLHCCWFSSILLGISFWFILHVWHALLVDITFSFSASIPAAWWQGVATTKAPNPLHHHQGPCNAWNRTVEGDGWDLPVYQSLHTCIPLSFVHISFRSSENAYVTLFITYSHLWIYIYIYKSNM